MGFDDTDLWPHISSAARRRQRACLFYYLVGSGSWGKSQMEALDGVAFASWLAMVQVEMGPGYCQFGVSGFVMAVGGGTLRCDLF